jgi:hypothetical protein
VSEPDEQTSASSGRGATVISQAYYYVVAAIGLIFLLGGLIAALIALRKWVFPISDAGSSLYGGPLDRNDAARSFLGALAFAIPGAVVLAWHLREARRREGRRTSRESWGGVLYFHLVALITLLIALGGVVATLHAVRDWALPICYDPPRAELSPVEGPVTGSGLEGEGISDRRSPVPGGPEPGRAQAAGLLSALLGGDPERSRRADRRLRRRRHLDLAPATRAPGTRRPTSRG